MGITDYQPISGCGSFEAALNGSLFSDGEGRQVIVLVNAGNWQHYKQGVLEQDMTDTANHYVLLTGMNKAENTWTVENSWGETWGEDGNARIAMGSS
jgi:C1A family cysteine protease